MKKGQTPPPKTDRPSSISTPAIIAALVLILASGTAYRVWAARLADFGGGSPLPTGTLLSVPLRLGAWVGSEVPLSERIVQATDTDDHLNRRYVHTESGDAVSVFIGLGTRFRDLVPHRPEVCYPGAGWSLLDTEPIAVHLPGDQEEIPARILRFYKSGLEAQDLLVLNYYIVDGRYCADVSLLRSRSWRTGEDIRYVCQVQIVVAARHEEKDAAERAGDLAGELTPALQGVLSGAVSVDAASKP